MESSLLRRDSLFLPLSNPSSQPTTEDEQDIIIPYGNGGHMTRFVSRCLNHHHQSSKRVKKIVLFLTLVVFISAAIIWIIIQLGANQQQYLRKGDDAVRLRYSPVPLLLPLGELKQMIDGTWPPEDFILTNDIREKSNDLARERREVVREAMKHAYTRSYERYTLGADAIGPLSGHPKYMWGGMGMTMIDALDTLYIMDLKEEFNRARDYIREKLDFSKTRGTRSFFETTIRALGGLLSAYDLSKDPVLLEKAKDLGERLLKAFDETPSGLPRQSVQLGDSPLSLLERLSRYILEQSRYGSIAEVGSNQLEFRSLGFHTRSRDFVIKSENVHHVMYDVNPNLEVKGLWPIYVNVDTGKSARGASITFGALADSFFEYLLKLYIQAGLKELDYLHWYEEAIDGLHNTILQRSAPSGYMYLPTYHSSTLIEHRYEHLTCFVPGLLALGVKARLRSSTNSEGVISLSDEDRKRNERDLRVAKGLLFTCMQMYLLQPTGLSPELVEFRSGEEFSIPRGFAHNILRPEVAESLYVLHQITGHPIYRDWGYQIMINFNKFARTTYGYGSLQNVRADVDGAKAGSGKIPMSDEMESFFLAETLKYLFLLQDPDSFINLDEFVFTTEAHPLKVFPDGWRERLMQR